MKINVKVKTNAKRAEVIKIDDLNYEVLVNKPPIENKANEEIIKILSEYLNIPRSKIIIKFGLKSKNKVVEIVD